MATKLEEKQTMKFGIGNVVAWQDVAACLFQFSSVQFFIFVIGIIYKIGPHAHR